MVGMKRVFHTRGMGQFATIFACGSALFCEGYVNAIAGEVNTILSRLYPDEYANTNYSTLFSSMLFVGTVVGMLSFGYIVDRYGRKSGMLAATSIIFVFTALSAGAYGAGGSTGGMLAALIAYRALAGVGIGAEYPSGSVACSESTEESRIPKKIQHMLFVLATNCAIDVAYVVAAFVPIVLLWITGESDTGLKITWRVSYGLGVVPCIIMLIWRLFMRMEPTRYRSSSLRKNVPYLLIMKRYWRSMIGLSIAWFLYDFITYPYGLFSSIIVDTITGGSTDLKTVFAWNIVINAFYVPGCFAGAFLADWVGPKRQLMIALCLQGTIGFFLAGFYGYFVEHIAGFAVIYGVFLSLGEVGPGDCLGLLASKTWPTAVRGQLYGIAAAVGKIGAFVGTWAFPAMIADFPEGPKQTQGPFWVGSGLAFLSAIVVFFTLKEVKVDFMAKEDAEFKAYLARNGYDVSQMGLPDVDSTDKLASIEDSRSSLSSSSGEGERATKEGKKDGSSKAPVAEDEKKPAAA